MFSKTAIWYDAIYAFKDYLSESNVIQKMIQEVNPHAKTVLDVACGTGEHAVHLKKSFDIDGIDFDSQFVTIAREKNPECGFQVADMASFHLGKKYDVVLCLFSSIGYVKTMERVKATLRCFADHLELDGAVILEPWFTPDTWHPTDRVFLHTGENDLGKVCRMSISRREGELAVLDFNYLIGCNGTITHETERHELGLFSVDQMRQAFAETGFEVTYRDGGLTDRGIYVGRLRR